MNWYYQNTKSNSKYVLLSDSVCFFFFVVLFCLYSMWKFLSFDLDRAWWQREMLVFSLFCSNLFCLYFLYLSPLTFLNAWDNAGTNHNSLTKIREWKVISSFKKNWPWNNRETVCNSTESSQKATMSEEQLLSVKP